MKKFILNLIFLCGIVTLSAQTLSLQKFYEKYDDNTLSIDINVPEWLKDEMADIDEPGARKAIKKAKRVKLLISEERDDWYNDIQKLKRHLSRSDYDELMTIRDDGELSLYMSEGRDRDGFRELIFFLSDNDDEGVLLSVKGTFNKDDIEEIMNDIHIENR